jgi:hypothetical protein
VFALEHFGLSFTGDPWIVNQQVTITGAGTDDPAPFLQNSTAKQRQLLINDQEGDDTRTLESYAKAVTADASGEIQIEIRRDDGEDVNRVILSGLAIQEIPPPPPVELDWQMVARCIRSDPCSWGTELTRKRTASQMIWPGKMLREATMIWPEVMMKTAS